MLTHDDDFLRPEYTVVPVLYYSDDTLDTYEIADRVDQLYQYIPDPNKLPAITNLGSWK
jgi:hypothetical protein